MQKNLHDLNVLTRFIMKRFVQDRCAQAAASLTLTTLLSLVPLITIAVTVFSVFPVFEDFSTEIRAYLVTNLMPGTAGNIARHMQQFAESATRLTAMGLAILAMMAMSMMLTIDNAFNVIWRVKQPRPLLKRLVVYWAVLTLAPLLIGASLSLTSWLVGLSMGYAKHIPIFGVGSLKILPFIFTTLAFSMLFRLVPNRYVPRSHALIGAVFAALVFETMNRIFGHYISHFPTYRLVYGAFASVPIFLMWIYLSWLSILFGAVIAASLSHWRVSEDQRLSPVLRMLDALRLLKLLADGMQQGKVWRFGELSIELNLGYESLEEMLERLKGADMVRKTDDYGWLIMRDLEHIKASELLKMFVMDSATLKAAPPQDAAQNWLLACVEKSEHIADVNLRQLFAKQDR